MPLLDFASQAPTLWYPDDRSERLACRGYLYVEGRLREGEALSTYLASQLAALRVDQLPGWLRSLNGAFALIWQPEGQPWALAAVDRMRSIPLFFHQHTLRDSVPLSHSDLDPAQADLFPYTGHTLGGATLHRHWRQLQAGQYALFSATQPPQIADYFSPAYPQRPEVQAQLWPTAREVFQRLVDTHADRPLVVPLSGGYDSRFIAAMLRHLGHPQVICYTYGRAEGFEAQISQQVAQRLGFPWHFVAYDDALLQQYLQPAGRSYQRRAAAGASLAHEQDWMAVGELQRRGVLPEDAVFLPGFGGDVLAGSWYPAQPLRSREEVISYLVQAEKFFSGPRIKHFDHPAARRLIGAELGDLEIHGPASAYRALLYWGWRNRLTKFLVNAVRVYEDWGYAWRLPFFDRGWMDTWLALPDLHKPGKAAYLQMAHEQLFGPLDVSMPQPTWSNTGWRQTLKRMLPPALIDWLKAQIHDPNQLDTTNAQRLAELFCLALDQSPRQARQHPLNYLMATYYLREIRDS